MRWLPCRLRAPSLIISVLAMLVCPPQGGAAAQGIDASEEALIRAELERIIAEDPEEAENARKALDALNQPANSKEGRQARNRRQQGARRIVNGLPARGHAAVGALLTGTDPRSPAFQCTGTLVGCDKFLTAAHCIEDAPNGPYLVFFQDLGFFPVKEVRWEKAKYKFPYFDLAMLTLARPVEGIAPMPINTSVRPLNKSTATIVGFGRTGGSRRDYGVKREGSVKTDACPAAYKDWKVLCWAFDADVRSRSSESNTCNGDSGGGIFMRDRDGQRVVEKVIGVVSGGRDQVGCVKNDISYNVDVFEFRDWIQSAGEGRLTSSMCGRPILESKEAQTKRFLLKLPSTTREAVETLEVPPEVGSLYVAMNGEDTGKGTNDFDLAVFQGDAKAGAVPKCTGEGLGVFAFCDIKSPASGSWTIVVKRKKGAGNVQVTTRFVDRRGN